MIYQITFLLWQVVLICWSSHNLILSCSLIRPPIQLILSKRGIKNEMTDKIKDELLFQKYTETIFFISILVTLSISLLFTFAKSWGAYHHLVEVQWSKTGVPGVKPLFSILVVQQIVVFCDLWIESCLRLLLLVVFTGYCCIISK